MSQEIWYKKLVWFSKCVRYMRLSMSERDLIDVILEKTWSQYDKEKYLEFVPYDINRYYFFTLNDHSASRGFSKLKAKNLIIIEDENSSPIKIRINFDSNTWIVTDEQKKMISFIKKYHNKLSKSNKKRLINLLREM